MNTPSTSTKPIKPSSRLVAIVVGLLVVAGGATATSVAAANMAAEEAARQCAVALKVGHGVTKVVAATVATADAALETVKGIALPANGGTSADYAARAGGSEQIATVNDGRTRLADVRLSAKCSEPDEAAAITAMAKKTAIAADELDTSVAALVDDFAAFQTEETARIAAEIEAARVAAEAEAARVAAEAAAAARAAAQRAAAQSPSGGGKTGGGSSPGAGASRPPSGGGGQVGPGNAPGTCLVDNGYGGVKAC